MKMKMKVMLLGILILTAAQAAVPNDTYPVTTTATIAMDTVEPVINSSSYIITLEVERDYIIPYGFTGESIDFAVNVKDVNGASDIDTVNLILSDDLTIDEDDTIVALSYIEDVNATTATFGASWSVPSASDLKYVLVNATDSTGLSAINNGINVGNLSVNPLLGFEIKDGSGNSLSTISFPSCLPGTDNVPSDQNTLQITNTDPNDVGMKIKVSVVGTAMTNGSNEIPISSMKVDEIELSETSTEIDSALGAQETASYNFYLSYPVELVSGIYHGSIDFEVEAI